jgi:hypothetical protein
METARQLEEDYPWTQAPLIVGAPMRLIALADMAVEISKAGTLHQYLPFGRLSPRDPIRPNTLIEFVITSHRRLRLHRRRDRHLDFVLRPASRCQNDWRV